MYRGAEIERDAERHFGKVTIITAIGICRHLCQSFCGIAFFDRWSEQGYT